jgi:hypothetical protein
VIRDIGRHTIGPGPAAGYRHPLRMAAGNPQAARATVRVQEIEARAEADRLLGEPSTVTIALPPIAIPAVTVVQARPDIITKRNAGHLGMTGPELLRILRAMSADPRFRGEVIRYGKAYRGAPPDAIVAFLRAAPIAAAEGDDEELDLELARRAGYVLAPSTSWRQR